jgi:hypothetical protein
MVLHDRDLSFIVPGGGTDQAGSEGPPARTECIARER